MENQIISIAIPTYNRAKSLGKLLECILSQIKTMQEEVQICISDNCSTDNTKEIVLGFQRKYPEVIKYNRNIENLGVDKNLVKIMEMADGEFVWLFGDDDMIVEGGIEKVVDFIKKYCNQNIGLINLGQESYLINEKTQEKLVYFDTVEKDKPEIYKIKRDEIITLNFPSSTFISVLLYNNNFLKKILQEKKQLIKNALEARDYVHSFIYQLMFLKYPQLDALRLNKKIIDEEMHLYKFYIEDKFGLHYAAWIKLNALLLSDSDTSKYYKKIISDVEKGIAKSFLIEMGVMKGFKTYNFVSIMGCIKIFFKNAKFLDALLFSFFFVIFYFTPSYILRNLYKMFIKLRHKDWEKIWFGIEVAYLKMSKGNRRLMS